MRKDRNSFGIILALLLGAICGLDGQAQPVCGDFDGCDPVILKVRGIVRDNGGTPLPGILVQATENRRRDVNAIDFFTHCGGDLHEVNAAVESTAVSVESPTPGFYELLFVVCAQDRNDFAADFDVCISAPGYVPVCLLAAFDDNNRQETLDFNLVPTGKQNLMVPVAHLEKGLPAGDCGNYGDCNMVLLKVRGTITDTSQNPINNAHVTSVLTGSNDIDAIQFYAHCGNGTHALQSEKISISDSGDSTTPGFYELLFAICGEDNNDVLPDEFDVDVQLTIEAPGFETQIVNASFDEESDRKDRDVSLVGGVVPTPTSTQAVPTATPTVGASPTALNPAADIDGSGLIDHKDLLEVLRNWYHIVP